MIKKLYGLTTTVMLMSAEVMLTLGMIEMSIDIAGRIKKIVKGEKKND